MDYIINPIWFYWLQVVSGISTLAWLLLGAALTGVVVSVFIWFMNSGIYENPCIKAKKSLKIFVIISIPIAIIAILIPSKDTMISMMVAKYATKTNAQLTVDAIKGAVDYIVQAIQSIK
jgi:hypothetical protein